MKRILLMALMGFGALFASGCTTVSTTSAGGARPVQMVRAEGLTVGDLLVSLNSSKPQADIIAEIKAKGLRSTLSAADIDVLTQNGASKEMVDALVIAGQQFPTTVATSPAVTTTSTYYGGYGWWPWAGFSYWSGYPYGYGYGGYYGGGYYSSVPAVQILAGAGSGASSPPPPPSARAPPKHRREARRDTRHEAADAASDDRDSAPRTVVPAAPVGLSPTKTC